MSPSATISFVHSSHRTITWHNYLYSVFPLSHFLSLSDSKASVAKAKLMETFCTSDTDDHSFLLPLWGSLVPLLPPKSLLPGCLCWLLLLSWNLNASVYQDSELFLSSFFAQMVLSWKPTAVGSTYRPTTLHILPSCDISPEPQTLPDFLPAISICDSLAKLCPTLCNPMYWSLPASSIHGIFPARIWNSL